MSAFQLSPEQEELRQVAARVASEVYAERAAEWDAARTPLPADEVRRLADLGFLGLAIPEEYGGQGGTLLDALIVIEELAKECRPAAFQVFEANTGPIRVLQFFGTEQQKRKYLPMSVSGELTMAIASPSRRPDRPPRTCAPRHVATVTRSSSTARSAGSPTAVTPTTTSCTAGSTTNRAPRASAR